MTRSDLLAVCRNELYSAGVSDTLDGLGYCNQAMAPGFTPLADETVLVGFARTGIYLPIYHDDDSVNVYEHEIELVDSLREDEVIVLSCADNLRITPWGELLSTRAKYLKAAGCITDGSVRDARLIRAMGFSVFSRGRNPVDTKHRGKMIWRDVPVDVGGVRINTGDFIIGDLDGVVVAPQAVADEAIAKALQKVRAESTVREELAAGQSLAAVFEKHRIL